MIPKGATGAAAEIPFSLVATADNTGTASHSWNDVGSGLTDELKVQLPDGVGTWVNATIAQIVDRGSGNYGYQLAASETDVAGIVAIYPNVSGHYGDALSARWDRIVDIAAAASASITSGTAQAGGATTITLASGASSTNDLYIDAVIRITGGTGAGQVNQITDYVGSTKVATVARTWATQPDSSSTYELLPAASPTAMADMTLEGRNVEGSRKLGDLIRGIVALVFGESDGWDAIRAAGGNGDAVYYAMDGTTPRVTVTYSTDGRTTITINSLAA